jgi:HPt (histidine-containing phosphotransfer) domain-containing protein
MADLDWNREFALEQAGEDEEMLKELMELLFDSSQADFERIREGLAAGDGEAASQAAHSIKGAAASLGMASLSRLANEIEKAGMAGDLDGVKACLPGLEQMIRQLAIL